MPQAPDTITLPDGTALLVRPIRPDDKQALTSALGKLSEQTIQRRFLSPKPRFSQGELRYLTELDGQDHVALVAELVDVPGTIVAVARFVRLPEDPETADIAIVVGDPYQRQGLGSQLGLLATERARALGIRHFNATMLGDNVAAHRLLRKLSAQLERSHARGTSEVLVDLVAEPELAA